ncbi:MAG: hypothetical protein ACREJ0_18305, partial [Geminicoccaceae bacterium]
MTLVAEQGDAPVEAQLPQADGGLRTGLTGTDDDHAIRHDQPLTRQAAPGNLTMLGPTANPRDEPSLQASDSARFGRVLRGDLILPDHPDYEAARKVWNGMVDKKPA